MQAPVLGINRLARLLAGTLALVWLASCGGDDGPTGAGSGSGLPSRTVSSVFLIQAAATTENGPSDTDNVTSNLLTFNDSVTASSDYQCENNPKFRGNSAGSSSGQSSIVFDPMTNFVQSIQLNVAVQAEGDNDEPLAPFDCEAYDVYARGVFQFQVTLQTLQDAGTAEIDIAAMGSEGDRSSARWVMNVFETDTTGANSALIYDFDHGLDTVEDSIELKAHRLYRFIFLAEAEGEISTSPAGSFSSEISCTGSIQLRR